MSPCSALFSGAMMDTMNGEEKVYCHLQIATHHLRRLRGKSSRQELEAEAKGGMSRATASFWLALAHSGLSSPESTGNKGDTPHTWPQANLMEEILCLMLLLLKCLHVGLKFTAQRNYISLYKLYGFFLKFCIYHHLKLRKTLTKTRS